MVSKCTFARIFWATRSKYNPLSQSLQGREAQNAICLILVPDEGHDQVVWKTPSRLIRLASSGYRWFQGKDSQVAKSLGLSKGGEVGVG